MKVTTKQLKTRLYLWVRAVFLLEFPFFVLVESCLSCSGDCHRYNNTASSGRSIWGSCFLLFEFNVVCRNSVRVMLEHGTQHQETNPNLLNILSGRQVLAHLAGLGVEARHINNTFRIKLPTNHSIGKQSLLTS